MLWEIYQVFLGEEDNVELEEGGHSESVEDDLREGLDTDEHRAGHIRLSDQALEVYTPLLRLEHYLFKYILMDLRNGPLAPKADSTINFHAC